MNLKLLVRIVPNGSKPIFLLLLFLLYFFLLLHFFLLPFFFVFNLLLFFLLANSLPLPEKESRLILSFETFFCVVNFLTKWT
jgi:hypothetical protein